MISPQPSTILIIQTAFIGDAILASSLVETLAKNRREARIDILVRKGNESLYKNNPHLQEVLVWDKKTKKYKNLYRLIAQIRSKKYDLVLNVQRFFLQLD
jgi:ADP-heptose:LPS heptosyltransferase